ncbi:MAG TPA: S41 family peptidase [Trueperaceae bacterium]|nr:S41 family peptidase [Trueperaceae bacterium]
MPAAERARLRALARRGARPRRPLWWAALLLALSAWGGALAAAPADHVHADYAQRFDVAWQLVEQRYWDVGGLDVDWRAMRSEYRPKALAAPDDQAFYAVLQAMYARINDGHTAFVPPSKVAELHAEYGDLPCLGVFGMAQAASGKPAAAPQAPPNGVHGQLGHVGYRMLADGIGYVRLPDLATDGTSSGVRNAVSTLQAARARALVLDLRGNPGGRLLTMMRVAGIFTSGFLWRVVTRWALPLPYPAIGPVATRLPLAVLVDGDVNSAAEGLAGALQKDGRATVVGARTAGNVEAVLPFCLADGSQAWIATGVLAPIGGPTWEGRGVVPDVPAAPEDALAAAEALLRRR